MAYTDFAATEARGMWSPPNGEAPQMIPDSWKDNPGDALRTDLPDKTDEELVALGWKKVDLPSYETNGAAFFSNSYAWNKETRVYDATPLEDFDKMSRVDYNMFWRKLINTDVYATLKTAASSALAANTLLTEFIALLTDAKTDSNSYANEAAIQASITNILAGITLTSTELAELQETFDSTGMSNIYSLS